MPECLEVLAADLPAEYNTYGLVVFERLELFPAAVAEPDGPVALWRADRKVDVMPAVQELARQAI